MILGVPMYMDWKLLKAYDDSHVHTKMSDIIKGIKMTDEFKGQEELNENVMKEINLKILTRSLKR